MKQIASRLGWFVINFIQAIFTVLWTALWVLAALVLLAVTLNHNLPLVMARRFWAAGLLWGARTRLEVHGVNDIDFSQPHVFVCNHQSTIDIPIVFRAIPQNLHFIIKKELFYIPFVGWFAWATGMIFVDRKNQIRVVASLRKIGRQIRAGRSVIAFPEGTRSRGQGIQPFKKGVFFAAIEAGVPVVPVLIEGADVAMPADSFSVRPARVRVTLGKPIATTGLSAADRARLSELTRERIHALRGSK